ARRDIDFYAEEACAGSGEVLEFGCGTGRVLIPIARLGKKITGIDSSPRMLGQCRAQLAMEPAAVRKMATVEGGDMRSLDLRRTFSIVTIPFRPFQHLISITDQIDTLRSAHRHLEPGGRLVFDVFNPNPRYFVDEHRADEREDTPETPLPNGRTFRRTGRVTAVSISGQYSDVELIYYVRNGNGKAERFVQAFPMRWFWRHEMEHLLARCGFRIDAVFGDFDRSPLTDSSPEMIFVAERT
ncbi:MAG: class I SAM-dependent methyltransferase, partial [Gemmatimonadales bacterium]